MPNIWNQLYNSTFATALCLALIGASPATASTPTTTPTTTKSTPKTTPPTISFREMLRELHVVFRHWKTQRTRKPSKRKALTPGKRMARIQIKLKDLKRLRLAILSYPKSQLDLQFLSPVVTIGVARWQGPASWQQLCMYWRRTKGNWQLASMGDSCQAKTAIQALWSPWGTIETSAPAEQAYVPLSTYFHVAKRLETLRRTKGNKYAQLKQLYTMSNTDPAATAVLLERMGRSVHWTDIANAVVGGNNRVLRQLIAMQGSRSSGNIVRSRQLLQHAHKRRGDPRILPAMRKMYETTTSVLMRKSLLYTLYQIGKTASLREVYPVFYHAIQKSQKPLHFNAILALKTQALREPGLLPIFRQKLTHKDWLVVSHAADAIARYHEKGRPALTELKRAYQQYPKARRSLLRAITRVAPRDRKLLPLYRAALVSKKEAIITTALLSIYRLKLAPKEGIPLYRQAMLSTFPSVRRRVLLILESHKSNAAPALPLLQKALKDPNLAVRTTAAGVFGEIGKAASSTAPLLLEVLRNARHRKMRQNALWSLLRIHPSPQHKHQGQLLGLKDKHPQIRYNALRSLNKADARTNTINQQLQKMRRDPHPQIRKVAIIRLRSLQPTSKPTSKPTSRPH